MLDAECRFFGAVQKPYGMETIMGNMNSVFLDRGIDCNMAIAPADTAALLRCRQETRDYQLNGALAQLYQYAYLYPVRMLTNAPIPKGCLKCLPLPPSLKDA